MSKVIWFIDQYLTTPIDNSGVGSRYFYLAKLLGKYGFKSYIITANYHHFLKREINIKRDFEIKKIEDINVIYIKTYRYRNSHSIGRVINWFLFNRKLKKLSKVYSYMNIKKPDFIISSTPSPISLEGSLYISKKFGAKYIVDIRDIWPETIIELGNISKNHPFILYMKYILKESYNNSYYIISPLLNAIEHVEELINKEKKFMWVPNGIDIEDYFSYKKEYKLEKKMQKELEFLRSKNMFIVGYAGTIGLSNDLETLIDAAYKLKYAGDICFYIVGKGKHKENIRTLVNKYKLSNVYIRDTIDKKEVPHLINFFDLCYIGAKKRSFYKYGIGANKIAEYMINKKPILLSYTGKGNLVEKANCGITCDAENPSELAKGIKYIKNLNLNDRYKLGNNGYKFALDFLDYKKIAKNFIEGILCNE